MDQINLFTISADTWLTAMAETTLRTSVIVLVAGCLAVGLRRGPATLRHLVWALALAGVLLAPVTGTYLPAIDLPLPSFSNLSAEPSDNATFAHDSRAVQRPDPGRAAPRVTQPAHGAAQTPTGAVEPSSGSAPAEIAPVMMPRVGGWPGPDRLTSGSTLPPWFLGSGSLAPPCC